MTPTTTERLSCSKRRGKKQVGQQESITLLDNLKEHNLIKIHVNEELEDAGWSIFLSQTKKGTSFVDCANLAVIEKYKFDGILSFDGFYKDKRIT